MAVPASSMLETPEVPAALALRTACPACGGTLAPVLDAGALPLDVGRCPATRAEAIAVPRGRVVLAHCGACGLVHNAAHDPDRRFFEPGYDVSLQHSATFNAFIEGVVQRLIARYDLHGRRVVEVGCGDGHVLRRFAALGGNRCLGIDPTVARERRERVGTGEVELVRAWFGDGDHADRGADRGADFVCCLSVFEAVPRPAPFLAALRALAAPQDAPVYLEIFNGWRALAAGEVWSVHYEQCNYFSQASLTGVLERHGFRVEDAGTTYAGDQYLFVEARVDPDWEGAEAPPAQQAPVPRELSDFADAFAERRLAWAAQLARWRERGERVAFWGTGGKGVTFLNAVPGANEAVDVVAEINPAKQGRHLPGTGQPIVAPAALLDHGPHHVIVANALYRDEMEGQARAFGLDATFHVA